MNEKTEQNQDEAKPEAQSAEQINAVRRSGRREPSPEMKERLKYMGMAIDEIKRANGLTGRGKPKKDIRGTIACPKCKCKLAYTVSSYNGHICGNCETNECLGWMM